MKSEILFKAKRANNDEWIEGDLLHDYWVGGDTFIPFSIRYKINGVYSFPIEVLPETVCQYTGIKDKNGMKIWEGSRIKSEKFEYYIVFENGAFYAYCINLKDFDGKPFRWGLAKRFAELSTEFEVIGNIHD